MEALDEIKERKRRYLKQWREKNKDRVLAAYDKEKRHQYYVENREKCIEASHRWRRDNEDRIKQWGREYRKGFSEEQKKKKRAATKEWFILHPNYHTEYSRMRRLRLNRGNE